MSFTFSSKRGITLLETLLVIALIALGLIVALSQYQKTRVKQNVLQIQNSVNLLGNALWQYYYVNCYWLLGDPNSYNAVYTITLNTNPGVIPKLESGTTPTLANYIANSSAIKNPYATGFGPAAYTYTIDLRGDTPALSISTQFFSTVSRTLWSVLQGALKPTSVDAKTRTFTWNITVNQPLRNQVNGLTPNLGYVNAMAGQLWLDITGRQYGMQYDAFYPGGTTQFTNVCIHWQQPQNRCTLTGVSARCVYQSIP